MAQRFQSRRQLKLPALAKIALDVSLKDIEYLRLDDILPEDTQILPLFELLDLEIIPCIINGRFLGEYCRKILKQSPSAIV